MLPLPLLLGLLSGTEDECDVDLNTIIGECLTDVQSLACAGNFDRAYITKLLG